MTSIVNLPANVLQLVLENLPFESHFDFICSCKRLYDGSRHVLRRHQAAHERFQVVSDLDPMAVLLLLGSAFGNDPLPAWHVRTFEMWRDRTSWDQWSTYNPSSPPRDSLVHRALDASIARLQPSLVKVAEYLDWFDERAFEGMYGDWNHKERALRQVESGHDGVLKALLIARCPRLLELRSMPRAADKKSGSALWWLKTLISISKCTGSKMPRPWGDDSESGESDQGDEESYQSDSGQDEDGEAGKERETETKLAEVEHTLGANPAYEASKHIQHDGETEFNCNSEWEATYARWKEQQTLEEELRRLEIDDDEYICRSQRGPKNRPIAKNATNDCTADMAGCPGFINLRSVSIGVVSNTWMDDDRYPCSLRLFARLLKLPNLDTLYFNGLRCDGSDHFEENVDNSSRHDSMVSVEDYDGIKARSSSVQHLLLEDLNQHLSKDVRERIIKAPRALLTATFRHSELQGCQVDTAAMVRDLAANQGATLESMVFWGYGDEATVDEKSALFRPYDFCNRFRHLKKVTFNVQDFATTWSIAPSPSEFFPASLQHLDMVGVGSGTWIDRHGQVVSLEQVIIEMIEGGRYKHLQAIVLTADQYAKERDVIQICLNKAVVVGKARGIAVSTRYSEPLDHSPVLPLLVNKN